jgi:UDP-N-acetylmuramoyl-tripeptide--D-alanyl-D-alanine ligase
MPLDAVKFGLEAFAPVSGRSQITERSGRTVLADYYNANPASMEAALAALVSLSSGRKSIAVLGDMLELGAAGPEAHRAIGRSSARLNVDLLITVGGLAGQIAAGARDAGTPANRVYESASHADAAELLRKLSRPGDVILIKGSRGMKMEKILEAF